MNEVLLLRVEEANRQLRGVRGFTGWLPEGAGRDRNRQFSPWPRSQQKCSARLSIRAICGIRARRPLLFPGGQQAVRDQWTTTMRQGVLPPEHLLLVWVGPCRRWLAGAQVAAGGQQMRASPQDPALSVAVLAQEDRRRRKSARNVCVFTLLRIAVGRRDGGKHRRLPAVGGVASAASVANKLEAQVRFWPPIGTVGRAGGQT